MLTMREATKEEGWNQDKKINLKVLEHQRRCLAYVARKEANCKDQCHHSSPTQGMERLFAFKCWPNLVFITRSGILGSYNTTLCVQGALVNYVVLVEVGSCARNQATFQRVSNLNFVAFAHQDFKDVLQTLPHHAFKATRYYNFYNKHWHYISSQKIVRTWQIVRYLLINFISLA